MKNAGKKWVAAWVVSICLLTGCMVAPVVPPLGGVFNSTTAPLDLDMDNTKIGKKRGEASSFCILGLISVGDASIKAAAEDGDITTVQHADYDYLNVLFGVFQRYTTIVYGE
jgi:hypothetical protein